MNRTEAWPRQPFIGIALAAIAGIVLADFAPGITIGIAVCAATALLALVLRRSALVYLFVGAAFFLLHTLRTVESDGARLARELGSDAIAVVAEGEVVSVPRISESGTATFRLALHQLERHGVRHPAAGTLLVRWRGDARYGDQLRLFGVIRPTAAPRNPGEFDFRAYLRRHDIFHTLSVRAPENGKVLSRGGGSPLLRAAQASRDWMQRALSRGLEDSPALTALIGAMVLGSDADTPDEIVERFQQTGTLHLFSVSGLHVGIVGLLLWSALSMLRVPRRWATWAIVFSLFFYSAITGLSTASLRASTMAALLLLGGVIERRVLPGNTIAAAAVLILCWDTQQLFTTGFQLSFAVVAAILVLANPIYEWLQRWFQPDPFLPRQLRSRFVRARLNLWSRISRAASVSLAAWIGSLPLILPYFYLVTPVALLANLVVVPIAFCVLAAGLLSLLFTPVAPAIAVIFNNANWALTAFILAAVELFAGAPGAYFYLGAPRAPERAVLTLTVLDVGAGAAIHARTRGRDWLIDTGSSRNFDWIVRGYLRSRGVNRLDGMVLSHGDAAHVGGAGAAIRALAPRELISAPVRLRSRAYQDALQLALERVPSRTTPAAGHRFALSRDVTAQVLHPPPGTLGRGPADDQALVIRLVVAGETSVLLMSDSGYQTEQQLLASGQPLRSDVLIKGQHVSGDSGSAAFLAAVQPKLVIASSASFPQHERVKELWAAGVRAQARLFRQDETGAVLLRFYRRSWHAEAFLGHEYFDSRSR